MVIIQIITNRIQNTEAENTEKQKPSLPKA